MSMIKIISTNFALSSVSPVSRITPVIKSGAAHGGVNPEMRLKSSKENQSQTDTELSAKEPK